MTQRQNDSATAALRLTPRQRDVLYLLSFRLTNAEIAATLSLSQRTVECHVASILAALQVANRREAAALAMPDRDQKEPAGEASALNRGYRDVRSFPSRPQDQ
jgi:DNA-binding NarL/FixJ family response regulator